jgi:hypothetical protein
MIKTIEMKNFELSKLNYMKYTTFLSTNLNDHTINNKQLLKCIKQYYNDMKNDYEKLTEDERNNITLPNEVNYENNKPSESILATGELCLIQ